MSVNTSPTHNSIGQCSLDLAMFLQAVAACESHVEKSRLALNLLPYYAPSLAFSLLVEGCAGNIFSQADLSKFLQDWRIDFCSTSLKGMMMDFCPIRNIISYEDFLTITTPKSFCERKHSTLDTNSVSDDLRFKIESSLVLFFLKEIKYQREVERTRLRLFKTYKKDIFELF